MAWPLLRRIAEPPFYEGGPLYEGWGFNSYSTSRRYRTWSWNESTPARATERLQSAVASGDVKQAQECLKAGASIRDRTLSTTLLHTAVEPGHAGVVALLLGHGVNVNAPDSTGNTALHAAAQRDHATIARMLLSRDADVTLVNARSCTPLHVAAKGGAEMVVRVLLAACAPLEARNDDHSQTPLLVAVSSKNIGTVCALLEAGADVAARDTRGETALHVAGRSPDGTGDIARALIAHGANVNFAKKGAMTPLHLAARSDRSGRVVRVLLAHGADGSARDTNRETPLHAAVHCSRPAAVRALLRHARR